MNDKIRTIEKIEGKLREKYLFESINKETRESITKDFTHELSKENYSKKINVTVTCDESNNPASLIDEGKIAIRVDWLNTVNKKIITANIIW
jgi:hypothetical protein